MLSLPSFPFSHCIYAVYVDNGGRLKFEIGSSCHVLENKNPVKVPNSCVDDITVMLNEAKASLHLSKHGSDGEIRQV